MPSRKSKPAKKITQLTAAEQQKNHTVLGEKGTPTEALAHQ